MNAVVIGRNSALALRRTLRSSSCSIDSPSRHWRRSREVSLRGGGNGYYRAQARGAAPGRSIRRFPHSRQIPTAWRRQPRTCCGRSAKRWTGTGARSGASITRLGACAAIVCGMRRLWTASNSTRPAGEWRGAPVKAELDKSGKAANRSGSRMRQRIPVSSEAQRPREPVCTPALLARSCLAGRPWGRRVLQPHDPGAG